MVSIALSVSTKFVNKTNNAPNGRKGDNKWALAAFDTVNLTPTQLKQHILRGYAISVAALKDNYRRQDHFISSQVMGVDFDHDTSVDKLKGDAFTLQHAFLIYATPSSTAEHPRSRALFILDRPITDKDERKKLNQRLLYHFQQTGEEADKACKDAVRIFYGSRDAQHWFDGSAVLPVDVLWSLPESPNEIKEREFAIQQAIAIEQRKNAKYIDADYETSYVRRAFERTLGKLGSAGKGERHDTLFGSACLAGSLVATGYLSESEAYSALVALGGGYGTDAERVARDGMARGMQKPFVIPVKQGKKHTEKRVNLATAPKEPAPKKVEIIHVIPSDGVLMEVVTTTPHPEKPKGKAQLPPKQQPEAPKPFSETIKPWAFPDLPSNLKLNLKYVSEWRGWRDYSTIAIRSALGTGKTELMKKMMKGARRVLVLTHRVALARNLSTRLDIELYKDYDGDALRRAGVTWQSIDKLCISFDSIWKLAKAGEAMPSYDLVIIDEVSQFLAHLDSGTMKANEPEKAYKMLKQVLMTAKRTVVADAHLSPASVDFINGVRPKDAQCVVVDNQYVPSRGNLTLWSDSSAAMTKAIELIDEDKGCVVIPVTRKRNAKALYHLMKAKYGDKAVVIHGDNSESKEVQFIINNMDKALDDMRVLIYTGSLGTGIDIQKPIRAVVGMFHNQPVGATDMHQMIMRFRNAGERHAWVQSRNASASEDWRELYDIEKSRAEITGLNCDFDGQGIYAVTPVHKSILRLICSLKAETHRQTNALQSAFVAVARHEGYEVVFDESEPVKVMKRALAKADRDVKAAEKEMRGKAQSIDHEAFETHQKKGTVTDEVRAGHDRFIIEDTVGLNWESKLDDDLISPSNRDKVRRFTDVMYVEKGQEQILKDLDIAEAGGASGFGATILTKRKHHSYHAAFLNYVMALVFGADWRTAPQAAMLTEKQIGERLGNFVANYKNVLKAFYGWREHQSIAPAALVRWLAGRLGVKLQSTQIRQPSDDGKTIRYRVYTIDMGSRAHMQRYGDARMAHLDKKRAENMAEASSVNDVTQNLPKYIEIADSELVF